MIVLLGASAILLTALQASINAPTRRVPRLPASEASEQGDERKGRADAFEAYLRNACGAQMGTLKGAVVAFRMKNGMARKAAVADADMTVEDYVATPVDNISIMADMHKRRGREAGAAPTPRRGPRRRSAAAAEAVARSRRFPRGCSRAPAGLSAVTAMRLPSRTR